MKNIFVLACSVLVLASCAEKNKESETIEEATIETPADSLPKEESTASVDVNTTEATEIDAVAVTEKKEEDKKTIEVAPAKEVKVEYASFGDKILADKALTKEQMLAKYKTMKKGDTIAVKFKSKINSVCKKKGCWMKMDLANNSESFVRFKDYGFFMPKDIVGKTVVLEGISKKETTSVDELKHYAEDAKKSKEEIAKITEPKKEIKFEAKGVLVM